MKPINKILSVLAGKPPLNASKVANQQGHATASASHDSFAEIAHQRKPRVLVSSAVVLTLCAFGAAGVAPLAPDAANLPVKTIVEELDLPDLASQIHALEQADPHFVSEEKTRPGDTLAALLSRMGVHDEQASVFIKNDKLARTVMQLKAGKKVQAEVDEDGTLQWLRTTIVDSRDNQVKNLLISRHGDKLAAEEVSAKLERRVEMRTGEIHSSLYAATDAAQIPDAVAKQIIDMFSTSIDFAGDLRRGDHFNIVYETFWQDGELISTGRVLAGEFVNNRSKFQAVWFDEAGSNGGYYTFDGKSLKKAFLKSPLEFSRVSSGFSMRVHPISGQWKQHKGVDFAAAIGTPIRASGDGVVESIGGQNGYGNTVVLKHWANYTTVYAHMSRFANGLRKGSKVNQGEVIGYVGMTGWTTGPHLHYEFRVNNEPRDPMSVAVPNSQPLGAGELARFKTVAQEMSHRFALLRPDNESIKLAMK